MTKRVMALALGTGCVAGLGVALPAQAAPEGWETFTIDVPTAQYRQIHAVGNQVWVVGSVNPAPTQSTILRHFDGAAWRQVGGVPDVGHGLAVGGSSGSDLWIGGSSDRAKALAHFDGTSWTTYAVPDQWNVKQIVDTGGRRDDVWAVLKPPSNNSVYTERLVRFDGTSWKQVTPPQVADLRRPVIDLVQGPDDLVVKYDETATADGRSALLRVNGTAFEILPVPERTNFGTVVSIGAAEKWTVEFSTWSEPARQPVRFDGTRWTLIEPNPANTGYRPEFAATGTLWATKNVTVDGYPVERALVRRTGSQWEVTAADAEPFVDAAVPSVQSGPWLLHYPKNGKQSISHYTG